MAAHVKDVGVTIDVVEGSEHAPLLPCAGKRGIGIGARKATVHEGHLHSCPVEARIVQRIRSDLQDLVDGCSVVVGCGALFGNGIARGTRS